MSRVPSIVSKIHHAALLAVLTAPLACGASGGEDDATSSALPVQAASAPTPCAATTVIDGDVAIATPQDAVAYRCVGVIRGNLSVLSAAGTLYGDVDLSNLTEVHGDVLLAYAPRIDVPDALREVRLGKLAAIVRDPPVLAEARAEPASAVAARSVAAPPPPPPRAPYVRGGRLVISMDFGTTVVGAQHFSLDQLSRVDADVSIETKGNLAHTTWRGPPGVASGLSQLTTVHGDLRLAPSNVTNDGRPNVVLGPFLSALRTVEGTVYFQPSWENENGVTTPIETIGGDLEIAPSTGAGWVLDSAGMFEKLTSVGGAIRVTRKHFMAQFFATAASLTVTDSPSLYTLWGAPTVGELRIERNALLRDLPPGTRVVGNGPIVIRDNASLSQCDVNAFVARQRSLGWTGIATTGGNLPGTSGGVPCP